MKSLTAKIWGLNGDKVRPEFESPYGIDGI